MTDGRDVPPDSAVKYIAETEAEIKKLGVGKIATVEGRYNYMDRDNRWERVKKGYDGVFAGVGAHYATAEEGVRASYDKKVYDEFIEPIVVGDYDGTANCAGYTLPDGTPLIMSDKDVKWRNLR